MIAAVVAVAEDEAGSVINTVVEVEEEAEATENPEREIGPVMGKLK